MSPGPERPVIGKSDFYIQPPESPTMADKEQGLSLFDIADFGENVVVPDKDGKPQKLKVKGISAQGVVLLLMRFPQLQKWLSGGRERAAVGYAHSIAGYDRGGHCSGHRSAGRHRRGGHRGIASC